MPICTKVPKEICNYDPHGSKRIVKKPLVSIYCREIQDDAVQAPTDFSEVSPGEQGSGELGGDEIPDDGKYILSLM